MFVSKKKYNEIVDLYKLVAEKNYYLELEIKSLEKKAKKAPAKKAATKPVKKATK